MLEDFSEENLKNKYKELSNIIMSNNLKRLLIQKEFVQDLNSLNEFHKHLVKNRLNFLIKEKSVKKDSYTLNENEIKILSKANILNFNYAKNKFLLKNLVSESFAFTNQPEEIINSIVFWDKVFENLHYFSTFNFDNKLLSKENFDEKFFNQKFVDKYFRFEVIDIDDLYFEKENEEDDEDEAEKTSGKHSPINNSTKKAFGNAYNNINNYDVKENAPLKNLLTKAGLLNKVNKNNDNLNKSLKIADIKFYEEQQQQQKTLNSTKAKNQVNKSNELSLIKKLFEGKSQMRRKILKLNQRFSYLPLDCNGFCSKLISFVKKRFFAHLFKNEEFLNFNSKTNFNNNYNDDHFKDISEANEKYKDFTLNDFKELEILIYKNCLFAHNQNEIKFHFLKYKTKFCKQINCNFLTCEKVHSDVSLGDELVLLYRKKNNDFKNLEALFSEKIKEAHKKSNKELMKKSNQNFNYNLNNLNEESAEEENDSDSSEGKDKESASKGSNN